VPVPHRVNLLWEDVKTHTELWLENIVPWLSCEFDTSPQEIWFADDLKNLVVRTYLRSSKDFKEDLFRGGARRHPDIIAAYRCMKMPRYVWVAELVQRRNLAGATPEDRKIEGEILFDSTGNRHAPIETLLSFHYDGLMYVPGRDGIEPYLIICPEERPYAPLSRTEGLVV
jgi:hypothetical protein